MAIRILAFIGAMICLILIFCPSAYAEAIDEDKVLEALSDVSEQVSQGSESSIADGLFGDADDMAQATLDMLYPKNALSEIIGIGYASLPRAVKLLCVLLGVIVISAVCNNVGDTMSGTGNGLGLLSSGVIVTLILTSQMDIILGVADFFERLGALMSSMIPITGAVWAMGGNVTGASVGTLTLGSMLVFSESFCRRTVIPVSCVCLVTAITTGLSEGILEGFSSGVKRLYGFTVGIVMTVLTFCLGAQTSIAGAADTLSARGAKALASAVIPGVGGAIGDTLRTVAGSVSYIKSIVGIGGILLIAAVTLPTLIGLLLARGVILLSSVAADMLGCRREQRMLNEIGNVYGLLIGAVSISSVAFVVALGIFVKCVVAAG